MTGPAFTSATSIVRAEAAGHHGDARRARASARDRVDERLGVLGRRRLGPRRAPALARVAEQRELRHHAERPARLEQRAVHAPLGVARRRAGATSFCASVAACLGPVVARDADEREQPLAHRRDLVAVDPTTDARSRTRCATARTARGAPGRAKRPR